MVNLSLCIGMLFSCIFRPTTYYIVSHCLHQEVLLFMLFWLYGYRRLFYCTWNAYSFLWESVDIALKNDAKELPRIRKFHCFYNYLKINSI